jgi:hypothetical protein
MFIGRSIRWTCAAIIVATGFSSIYAASPTATPSDVPTEAGKSQESGKIRELIDEGRYAGGR